ncbi:hypothetical protein [Xanthomonas sp. 3498]|uniref:hypothetical protein n=1 Tax=Xanthomonas sp. 3498 TaxID=2663863 RepID=UPI001607B70F|nr:hypothetical protein [Xanthomonas sp. 3498]MBB5876183.1 hypothetical protein [Xanthomonas sp. 3498]
MTLKLYIQNAKRRLDMVRWVIQKANAFPPEESRDRIALALIQAALGDAVAITVLLDHSEKEPLAGPALTLLRPLNEKLKRASWAFAAEDEAVVTAYQKDKFPNGDVMVRVIEAVNPEHDLFTRLFEASPRMVHAFVHGGAGLISGYMGDSTVGGRFSSKALAAALEYIGDLAVEAGLLSIDILAKYDKDSAFEAMEKLNTAIR